MNIIAQREDERAKLYKILDCPEEYERISSMLDASQYAYSIKEEVALLEKLNALLLLGVDIHILCNVYTILTAYELSLQLKPIIQSFVASIKECCEQIADAAYGIAEWASTVLCDFYDDASEALDALREAISEADDKIDEQSRNRRAWVRKTEDRPRKLLLDRRLTVHRCRNCC